MGAFPSWQPGDLDRLRHELRDRAAEVAQALLGPANPAMSGKCELRFGSKGSFSMVIAGPKAGLWHDHQNAEGGDILGLIVRVHGCAFREACGIAAGLLGRGLIGPAPVPARSPESGYAAQSLRGSRANDDPAVRKRQSHGREVWSAARDIAGTPAADYLKGRGLELPGGVSGRVLRFHSACPFGSNGERRPAMIALMRHIETDEPQAIHRTDLLPDRTKRDRKVLGPKVGSAIKLTADCDVTSGLHVAEGIETALAAMAFDFVPMWSLIDSGQIGRLPALPGIEALTVIVDNDAGGAGQKAAARCSETWRLAGREVRRVIPSAVGSDFNDVLREATHAG